MGELPPQRPQEEGMAQPLRQQQRLSDSKTATKTLLMCPYSLQQQLSSHPAASFLPAEAEAWGWEWRLLSAPGR